MRRSDREITDFNEILRVINDCSICRLAFNDGEYPYIVPLNFGMKVEKINESKELSMENSRIIFFFHGATEGKKYQVMSKNNKAFFEMDCNHKVTTYLTDDPNGGHCTFEYESVMGTGIVEMVEDKDKMEALTIMTDHYHSSHFEFNPGAIPRTNVFKLTVNSITAKRRPKPEHAS